MEWIAIKEQQPILTGYYLVCYSKDLLSPMRYAIRLWLASEHDWISFDTPYKDLIEYWAYLPDPPPGFEPPPPGIKSEVI